MNKLLQKFLMSLSLIAGGKAASAAIFTNSSSITIVDNAPASLYPSPINVSGLSGVISGVSVTINGLTHGFVNDVAFILQAPNGRSLLIQSSVADNILPISNYTYTISDAGATQFHVNNAFANGGTYKPTAFMAEEFDLPAPLNPAPAIPGTTYDLPGPFAGGTATFSSVFGNANPNGQWKLFIMDFAGGDDGAISGGWSLNITTNVALANEDVTLNVVNNHCQPLISWSVANSSAIEKFAIQRSENGGEFIELANVDASKDLTYQYIDNSIRDGQYLYRIAIKSLEGSLKYTESKGVTIACWQNQVSLVPNPVADIAYLEIQSNHDLSYTYQIVDMMGRNVSQGKILVNNELKQVPLVISHLPNGFYSMQIQWQDGMKSINFMKL